MIRVFLVEDSPTATLQLRRMLESAPDIELAGTAATGLQAQARWPSPDPDVLITDLRMPEMDGLALIRWAMAHRPVPILVLSEAVNSPDEDLAFQCLGAGAVDVQPKPRGGQDWEAGRAELLQRVRLVSGVKVVRRRPEAPAPAEAPRPSAPPEVVALGASTGGPQALLRILQELPPAFPAPLLVVQHMSPGFTEGMVHWMRSCCRLGIALAEEGQVPLPGSAYMAPDDRHLLLDGSGRLRLSPPAAGDLHVPSVDRLFHSVARAAGPGAWGVLLTGMGRDGAEGLLAIRRAGGATLVQDEASCAIYGMPKAALQLGAADRATPLDAIADTLAALSGANHG